jgi:hypothetical protein
LVLGYPDWVLKFYTKKNKFHERTREITRRRKEEEAHTNTKKKKKKKRKKGKRHKNGNSLIDL